MECSECDKEARIKSHGKFYCTTCFENFAAQQESAYADFEVI